MNERRTARRQRAERSRSARIAIFFVAAALAAFALGYLVTTLLFFPAGRRDVATVPDVRGHSVEEARRVLSDVGLDIAEGSTLAHPEAPAGTVLAQSPLPGREVTHGSIVRVTLSGGRERRAVPDVGSLASEQARQRLARAGFEVEIQEVENDRRAGTILEINPAAGTRIELPGPVRLLVSSGPPPVDVPDLVDLPEDGARALLASAGLRLGQVEYDPTVGNLLGEVVAQQPAAGASLPRGSPVHVTVSGIRTPEPVLVPPQIQ